MDKIKQIIDESGTQRCYQNDQLHRDNDQPAIIDSDGRQECYYQNGQLHRNNDLPALIISDGTKKWYQNGEIDASNIKG